jgi:hypothetical protein
MSNTTLESNGKPALIRGGFAQFFYNKRLTMLG